MRQQNNVLAIAVLGILLIGSVNACSFSNQSLQGLCLNISTLQSNLQNNVSSINILRTNIKSNFSAISNSYNTIYTNFTAEKVLINELAANKLNVSVFTIAISNTNANVTSAVDRINVITNNITNIDNTLSSTSSDSTTALSKTSSTEANATLAINRANQALADVAGLQNTSDQAIGSTNMNVTNLRDNTDPVLALNLTKPSNEFSSGISTADIIGIIAAILAAIGLFLKFFNPFGNAKPKDSKVEKVIHGEEKAKAETQMNKKEQDEALLRMKAEKEQAEKEESDRAKMKADPAFETLRLAFVAENAKRLKENKKMAKSGLEIAMSSLKSFKALKAKMAEYGVNIDEGEAK